jgi:hypothetical protein
MTGYNIQRRIKMIEVMLSGNQIVKKKFTSTEENEFGFIPYNWIMYAEFCDAETARAVLRQINGVIVTEVFN